MVVTAGSDEGPAGFLGLSATHVCAEPPLMLVSLMLVSSDKRTLALAQAPALQLANHQLDEFVDPRRPQRPQPRLHAARARLQQRIICDDCRHGR
jgi:hypothetical protein